jgi:putative SOS response-associated peptidase YedK
MINARAETVHEKPAFIRAFSSRRLALPIEGLLQVVPHQQIGRSGKPFKQPFYLHPRHGSVLALAGIFEFWRDKTKADDDPDRWLTTFTILTTSATDDVGHIHDRMPMTIARENLEAWLDPRNNDVDQIRS